MKKFIGIFALALLISASQAFSQGSTVTVFSASGEKFILEVNGSRQNSTPESRVYADGIGGPMVKIKVYVDETGVAPVSKSSMNKPNGEFFYVLEKDKKGKYVLQSTSHDWSADVKKEGAAGEETAKAATTEKNEQKSTGTGNASGTEKEKKDKEAQTGKGRCESPISDADFYSSSAAISHAPFDAPKLNNAKNLVRSKCLSADQVRQVMYIFDGEKTKLDFAKYAYDYVYDPDNYDAVNDALRQKSIDELNKYLESRKQ